MDAGKRLRFCAREVSASIPIWGFWGLYGKQGLAYGSLGVYKV